jgi:hypothetical protein
MIVERLDSKSPNWWRNWWYESSQISRCDSKSNRSCMKRYHDNLRWWDELMRSLLERKVLRFVLDSLSHQLISSSQIIMISLHLLSFNIFSQSDISMLRLIDSSDWSDEWCRSNEVISEISRVFVETALWWNRLLTSLQSNINSHWFDSSESLVSISVYKYQHVSA